MKHLLCLCLMLAAPLAQAQMQSPAAPYAGEQSRAIKALSSKEVNGFLQGQGMGLAKAAELNGFPGPMHVLEHTRQLALTADQRAQTEVLMKQHKEEVRGLGAQLVAAEQALDQAFAQRQIDEVLLRQKVARIAQLQGEIRAAHLATHLKQTALLNPQQIERYAQLRGYRATDGAPQEQ